MYSDDNYLDIGFIADYCRYYSCPVPESLWKESSMTPVEQLRGEVAPLSIQSKRSQALMFAWSHHETEMLTRLMLANTGDLCFQLYGIICNHLHKLIVPVLARDDLCMTELAIIHEIAKSHCFDSVMSYDDVVWLTQNQAEKLLCQNHSLLKSSALSVICMKSKETDLSIAYNRITGRHCRATSSAFSYFQSIGMPIDEIYELIIAIPGEAYKYSGDFCSMLLNQVTEWTEHQKEIVKRLMKSNYCSDRVVRYSNYKSLYSMQSVFHTSNFILGQFDTCAEEKLALLKPTECLLVLKMTLTVYPCAFRIIPERYNFMLCSLFTRYSESLQEAYDCNRESLRIHANTNYELVFLKTRQSLAPFIDSITVDSFSVFLERIDDKVVRMALFDWCRSRNELYRLASFSRFFSNKDRSAIAASNVCIIQGKHPAVNKNKFKHLCIDLQVFAAMHNFLFKGLSEEGQELLSHAVVDEGTTWICKLSEDEIVDCVNLCLKCKSYRTLILRAILKYGAENFESIEHYYVYLHGSEYYLVPEVVCQPCFRFVRFGQSLKEAEYKRGREFEACTGYEKVGLSDSVLDYYQWCGSDDHLSFNSCCYCDADFAKYFCKYELGHDIDDWDIKSGSPLLKKSVLESIDWTREQRWLCRSQTNLLVNSDLPAEVLEFVRDYGYKVISKNLQRHPLEWYQQFSDWKQIIQYDFEWNEVFCKYWKATRNTWVHKKSELFSILCNKSDYETALYNAESVLRKM